MLSIEHAKELVAKLKNKTAGFDSLLFVLVIPTRLTFVSLGRTGAHQPMADRHTSVWLSLVVELSLRVQISLTSSFKIQKHPHWGAFIFYW